MAYSIANNIKHRFQQTAYSCGAACISMILDCDDEETIRKELKTTTEGTCHFNVLSFLKKNSIPFESVIFKESLDYDRDIRNLVNLSFQFPVYLSCSIFNKYHKVGRARVRHHAILLSDGLFYDPSETKPLDMKAFRSVANKKIDINSAIIFDVERPNFIKNHSSHNEIEA